MAAIDETVGIDPERLRCWADRFLDAWNASDAEALAALCTEDVVWTDPSAPQTFAGRDGIREFVRLAVNAFPDLHIAETSPPYCTPGASTVLSPYRMTGTMLGPMDVFAPTGRSVCVDGVDEWTFRGELLCRYRTYYDTIDAARQLGIMPTSGSRAERLMSRLQHAQARIQRRTPTLAWRLWYLGWRQGSLDPDPDLPVFVSLTDFRFHAPRHAPGAWRAGLRLRRSWPQLEGAIGLWLWGEPLRLRSGSVSIWRSEEDLMRFIRSPAHRTIVREYRSRMSGTSRGWTAPRFDRPAIWTQAVSQLMSRSAAT